MSKPLFIFVLLTMEIFVFLTVPSISLHDDKYRQFLKNRHLIITATRSPIVKDRELTTVSLGLMEEIILNILAEHLKFTYEVHPPKDQFSAGNLLKNGSWTGTSGQIQRKEVDMCVTTAAPTSLKMYFMEVSYPLVFTDAANVIPFPSERSKVWIDTSAFDKEAWGAIGASLLFMIVAAWLINRITFNSKSKTFNSFSYWVFYFVSIWTSQGSTLRNPSTPFRMVCFVSIFGIFIISNYFTASYTSYLSIPIFKSAVDSIEDLATTNQLKTLLIKGSSTDDYIMTSTDPTMKKIADQMRRHPERRILNALRGDDISSIVKEDHGLVIIKSNGESVVEQSYELNNQTCRVTLAEKTFFSRGQSFQYPLDSPIARAIDLDIMLMHQAGLIQYAERRSATTFKGCSVNEIKKIKAGKAVPLSFNDLSGAFVIVGTGLTLSCLALIIELSIARMTKK